MAIMAMTTGQRWDLFARLVQRAVASLDGRTPTPMVAESSVQVPPTRLWAQAVMVAPEAFGEVLASRLTDGPVVAIPPWERLNSPVPRPRPSRTPYANTYEMVLAECAPADPESVMAAILPGAAVESRTTADWRARLGEQWQVPFVIYATNVFDDVDPRFTVAAIVLRASADRQPKPTRIYRIPAEGEPDAIAEDFERVLRAKGGHRLKHGYATRIPVAPADGYGFDRNDPAVARRQQAWAEFGQLVALSELCETPDGRINLTLDRKLLKSNREPGAARVLRARDVLRDGTLAPSEEDDLWAAVSDSQLLRQGDLLVRRIARRNDPSGLLVAEVSEADLPAVASDMLLILRPRAGVSDTQIELLRLFLGTSFAKTLVMLDNPMHIPLTGLRELRVPQPDKALTSAIKDLKHAAGQLEAWRSEATSLLETVFLDEPRSARSRLLESGRRLRMRTQAASLVDDFPYAVRTRYPYPIALRWRHVHVALGSDPAETVLKRTLRMAEAVATYVALLGVVAAREAGISLGAVGSIRAKLQSGRGTTFDDWLDVLLGLPKGLSRLPDSAPLIEVRGYWNRPGVAEAWERLKASRNDEAHEQEDDVDEALQQSQVDLQTVLAAAEFLCDLKLIYVFNVRYDSLADTSTVRYREMMGDHSVVPAQTLEYPGHIEDSSLYIKDERGLYLLRPFILGLICKKCSQWGTFHVSKVPKGTDDVLIKCLDHEHPRTMDGLREPLRLVGLL
ncbi:hypothetical protein [Micromonospora sp. LH3U1]|uniref:hypothetical protein n=1 Tax=Micromonospora sp. LH3U1 TaxID=3018339 RepID=UPI00234B9CA9|nr:hypothetical protein [Micromonospora sp. LH3U1]WCN83838.1 hypothetical protein PCA76_12715 [Micromonospora sp. LH3U1]